jgi:integrase
MSDKTVKEVALEYLSEPTKFGRAKNSNAHACLEWMYQKRPATILIDGRTKPCPYGPKNSLKPHTVVSMDETSGIFEGMAMRDVSNIHVTQIRKALRNYKGLSNDGINTYLVYLRRIINYAETDCCVDFVRRPKIEILPTKGRTYALTPKIFEAWIRFLDPLRADLVRFGVATGQRKANVNGLKWCWTNRDLSRIVIPAEETKNNTEFSMYLNKAATEVLKKRRLERKQMLERYPALKIEHVFFQADVRHRGKPMADGSINGTMWERSIRMYNKNVEYLAEKQGREVDVEKLIPKGSLVFHSCRHTFGTWLKNAGHDAKDIADFGGWKSTKSCERYIQKDDKRMRKIGSSIDNFL